MLNEGTSLDQKDRSATFFANFKLGFLQQCILQTDQDDKYTSLSNGLYKQYMKGCEDGFLHIWSDEATIQLEILKLFCYQKKEWTR